MIVLLIIVPFSPTAWLKLSGPVSFFLTVGFLAVAILILVICRIFMCRLRRRQQFRLWSYSLWMIAELLVIAHFYAYVTLTLRKSDLIVGDFSFATLLTRGLVGVTAILFVSNTISILWSIQRDQKERLKLLSTEWERNIHDPAKLDGKPITAGGDINTTVDVASRKKLQVNRIRTMIPLPLPTRRMILKSSTFLTTMVS
ncbi:MAG TPA: hypothetical protein PK155_06605 [Bacteroidales bacterium]|nr:hypothetical protein [Bacteroidales bacterium]